MSDLQHDSSADTARFKAFAAGSSEELPAPWRMRAPWSKIGILVAAVVVVAILAAIFGRLLAG
jgi:hypothetical protein